MHDDVTADGSIADGTDSRNGSSTGGDRAPAGRKPRRSTAEGAEIRPGSLLWTTAGDPRALIPGLATGIMQLMLPGLGAGVTDHSNFFDDPFDRIYRSVPYIWASIFAADEQDARFVSDPWQHTLEPALAGRTEVSVDECLGILNIEVGKRARYDGKRLAAVLMRMRFARKRVPVPGFAKRQWRYVRQHEVEVGDDDF